MEMGQISTPKWFQNTWTAIGQTWNI